MATHARQQYFADENSLSKERREFSIADDIQQKIDSVEEGAQVNRIEAVKVNGTALVPDAAKAVNVEVPDVIDNLYSTSTDDALSAKQGKVLYDYIQNIASRGRFLSNWDSATGLPVTNPTENPYPYKAGDYYSVGNVATGGGTNYRPDGSSYTIGQASTTIETEEVNVSDFYLYDGTSWLLLVNTARQIAVDSSLSTTSTNPVENRVVTNAINGKYPGAISNVMPSNPVEGMLWYDTTNDQLKVYDGTNWNVAGKEYNAGKGISIGTAQDYSAMQGPAPDGFHVPLSSEWEGLKTITDGFSLTGDGYRINLHMPFAGRRNTSASTSNQGNYAYYWSSSPYDSIYPYNASGLLLTSSSISTNVSGNRANGYSVRCFKNFFIAPTSSWVVITGTLGGAGIFRNQTEGLISITSDGATGYTIQDKNLGATTVYNDGDVLSEANCGKYYQWGNNYGFSRTGTVTTSSTQVDASNYGPGDYYSSSTFITGSTDRSSVHNDNLWGATTGVVTLDNVITNTGVLSVNGQTGNVIISSGDVLVSDQANNIFTPGMKIWGGTEGDFNNLTPDSNTAYLLLADQPTPGRLPTGYTELQYIDSNGQQILNSGVSLTSDYLQIQREIIYLNDVGAYNYFYNSNTQWMSMERSGDGKLSFNTASTYSLFNSVAMEQGTDYTYDIIYNNGTQTLNGTSASYSGSISNKGDIYFFVGGATLGNAPSALRCYSLKLYTGNDFTLVRDFVPAVRDNDGVAGLYDIVNDVFYTSTTATDFIAGPSA